jgi:cell division septum initiation protein DivIVA
MAIVAFDPQADVVHATCRRKIQELEERIEDLENRLAIRQMAVDQALIEENLDLKHQLHEVHRRLTHFGGIQISS